MLVDSVSFNNIPCSKCGCNEFNGWGYSMSELDKELFIEWANNPDLFFLSQDEELIIAEEKYIDYILYILDNNIGTTHKTNILIHALCVLIYDYSVDDCRDYKQEEATRIIERVKTELLKRKNLLKEAEYWIPEYIKAIVFPIIDRT